MEKTTKPIKTKSAQLTLLNPKWMINWLKESGVERISMKISLKPEGITWE
jgi:hypothetical protein